MPASAAYSNRGHGRPSMNQDGRRRAEVLAASRGQAWWTAWLVGGCLVAVAGCHPTRTSVGRVVIENPWPGSMTVAVAPAINLSGSRDFDPDRFADVMARELGYGERIHVVPVSRVLAVLSAQGKTGVESPGHALELVRLLGVDAILVFSVTDYDAYDPPSIGITGQLYGRRPEPGLGGLDPVALSREASSGGSRASRVPGLLAQSQQVFDAAHESVVNEVRLFAEKRGAGRSAYGWRAYLVSQEGFIEYCCHAIVESLLHEGRMSVRTGMESQRVGMP